MITLGGSKMTLLNHLRPVNYPQNRKFKTWPPLARLESSGGIMSYKPVHRYAVALLRNSRFYLKFNRVAVDRFIDKDINLLILSHVVAAT